MTAGPTHPGPLAHTPTLLPARDDASALWAALEQAERSDVFARTPLLRRVLRFLVTAACTGEGATLTPQRVALEAFGKATDFDPTEHASVRTEMARLRRLLDRQRQYEPHLPGIEIPRASYRPRLVAPLGERRSASSGTWGRAPRAPLDDPGLPRTAPPPGPGVMVFGLAHAVPPTHAHLAFGLMRQLFADLSRHRYLHLVDALDLDPQDRGGLRRCVARHGCRYALQGESRPRPANAARATSGIALRLWLFDAARGTTAWQGTFVLAGAGAPSGNEAGERDVVDHARAVAAQVATALGATLGVITHATTHLPTPSGTLHAHGTDAEMTMRFNLYAAGEHTPDEHGALLGWARQRVAAVPWCALAWSMLGTLLRDAYLERIDPESSRETALADAGRCLSHALALDPAFATAALTLASVHHAGGDLLRFRHWLARALAMQDGHAEHALLGGALLCLAGDSEAGTALVAGSSLRLHPAPGYCLARALAAWAAGDLGAARLAAAQMAPVATTWRMQFVRALVFAEVGDAGTAQLAWARAQAAFGQVTRETDAGIVQAGLHSALRALVPDPTLAARALACLDGLGQRPVHA